MPDPGQHAHRPTSVLTDQFADHASGRSRGGWITTLHLATEQGQKPLSSLVTAGQRGDSPQFEAVLAGIRVAPNWSAG
jgi:hypothetical protein